MSETAASCGLTVFVLDEDEGVRESLTALVRSMQIDVESYASDQEFIDAFDGSKRGCLLLDARTFEISRTHILENVGLSGVQIGSVVLAGPGKDRGSGLHRDQPSVQVLQRPATSEQLRQAIRRAAGIPDLS